MRIIRVQAVAAEACGSGWTWLVSGRRRVAVVLNGTDVLNGIDDGRCIARSIRKMTFVQ